MLQLTFINHFFYTYLMKYEKQLLNQILVRVLQIWKIFKGILINCMVLRLKY